MTSIEPTFPYYKTWLFITGFCIGLIIGNFLHGYQHHKDCESYEDISH